MDKTKGLLPIITFLGFLAKTMIIPATFPDSIILCALISYIVLDNLRLKDQTHQKYEQKLVELALVIEKQGQRLQGVESSITAVKASTGLRQITQKNS